MNEFPRFPAEWEPQAAVLMAWPHAGTDWAERLDAVARCFARICSAICAQQRLILCVPDADIERQAREQLVLADCRIEQVRFVHLPYNDTWLRDSGPISLNTASGHIMLDFQFTAWGGKFQADLDDQIVAELLRQNVFHKAEHRRIDFALEGGGIETDGQGNLLSTWHCLHERHPDKSREQISTVLMDALHQQRVLWLDHGYLEGDDTDAHIDTLARFSSTSSIIYQGCQNPSDNHYAELQAMAAELRQFRQTDGQAYTLYELPWPEPILDDGRRLAASYANFLIINGAVMMPVYGDPADTKAIAVMQQAFPAHKIVAINCRDLIWQNGSLHCCTMQIPQGLLT